MMNGSIKGVTFVPPKLNPDHRGSLDVVFDDNWFGVPSMSQWNVVRSKAGVLRGLHAHSRYHEIYTPVTGNMLVALKDARRNSSTFGNEVSRWMNRGNDNQGVVVPPGVLHGIYFQTDGILAYGLSSSWTGHHEFNCLWNDPDLNFAWPVSDPLLSEKDATGGTYKDLVIAMAADLQHGDQE